MFWPMEPPPASVGVITRSRSPVEMSRFATSMIVIGQSVGAPIRDRPPVAKYPRSRFNAPSHASELVRISSMICGPVTKSWMNDRHREVAVRVPRRPPLPQLHRVGRVVDRVAHVLTRVRLAVHHPPVMEQAVAEVDLQERAHAADRRVHRDLDLRLRGPVQAAGGGALDGDVGNVRAVEFDEQAQDDPAQSGSAATRPKLNVSDV